MIIIVLIICEITEVLHWFKLKHLRDEVGWQLCPLDPVQEYSMTASLEVAVSMNSIIYSSVTFYVIKYMK